MKVRFASGLFRLWVVLSVLWLAGAGAYIFNAYQNVELRDLKKGQVLFDDLIPAYQNFCDYEARTRIEFSDEQLTQIAECERTADRWSVLKNGILIAVSVPIIVLVLGWALVWAFRGFSRQKAPSAGTRDEARRIAANIAKLPELLLK